MKDIRQLEEKDIREFLSRNGEKSFRSTQIMDWLWNKSEVDFGVMSNLPAALRIALSDEFHIQSLSLSQEQVSSDGTRKYGFSSEDGLIVEGVLIPSKDRVTACISSQIGCPLKCTFCATGRLSPRRDLLSGEIFDQVNKLQEKSREAYGRGLTNLVFMGMGEPLLNYDNVLRSIQHMTSGVGLGISPRRITVSTAGITGGIRRLASDKVKFELAISLHTANNEKRNSIMPVNRNNPIPELSDAISEFHRSTGTRITYEYLLMKDFNDSLEDARELAEFCRISPCKINLIEYNEVEGSGQQKTLPGRMKAFAEFLESKNLVVNIRRSRGEDIDAACGQLAANQS